MSRKKVDIFSLKFEGTLPTREDISNPFRNRNEIDLLIEGNVIDLRDNHIVEELPNGYMRVVAIDKNKKFKKE